MGDKGEELMKKGDKLSKGGFFRRADYDGAAVAYKEAALAYRAALQWRKCVDAYCAAADANGKNNIWFTSGEMLESAATVAHDKLKDDKEAGSLYQRASVAFVRAQSAQKACDVLKRGAKVLEASAPDTALDLCHRAIDIFREADRMLYTADLYKLAIAIAVRARMLADAVEVLRQWRGVALAIDRRSDAYKAGLALVVVHLARDDAVAAGKDFEETCVIDTAFVQAAEGQAATELLDAYDAADGERLEAAKKRQVFDFLEPEVTRLARKLVLEVEGGAAEAQQKQSVFGREGAERTAKEKPGEVRGAVEAMALADATMADSTAQNIQQRRAKEERERMLLFAPSKKSAAARNAQQQAPAPEEVDEPAPAAAAAAAAAPVEDEPKEEEKAAQPKQEAEASTATAGEEAQKEEEKPAEQDEEEEEDDPYGLC